MCPKNGIAACCLGFVGDTPILIHAIKLLCTISDNPENQSSSSCRQADIEKTHTELGGGGGGGRVSIPGPWTKMAGSHVRHTRRQHRTTQTTQSLIALVTGLNSSFTNARWRCQNTNSMYEMWQTSSESCGNHVVMTTESYREVAGSNLVSDILSLTLLYFAITSLVFLLLSFFAITSLALLYFAITSLVFLLISSFAITSLALVVSTSRRALGTSQWQLADND